VKDSLRGSEHSLPFAKNSSSFDSGFAARAHREFVSKSLRQLDKIVREASDSGLLHNFPAKLPAGKESRFEKPLYG
jgi:hypothetical protein